MNLTDGGTYFTDEQCWTIWLTFDADLRLDDNGNPIPRELAVDYIRRWLLEPDVHLDVLDQFVVRLMEADQYALADKLEALLDSRRKLN
jgi:hypothetical protein